MIRRCLCVAFLPFILSACASDPAPTEQMRLTEQALGQAQALGVTVQQSQPLYSAENKLALAQSAMQSEDYKQARIYAEQAELDARLAEAQLLTEKSQQQLGELSNNINRLRKQLGGLQ